ncbi:MAG TPA: hypothetical protein VD928_00735 [Candidatus Paceibacterota bacterium]|nr:hypothetical protein [Candidatus Paceibacterota bacterium]
MRVSNDTVLTSVGICCDDPEDPDDITDNGTDGGTALIKEPSDHEGFGGIDPVEGHMTVIYRDDDEVTPQQRASTAAYL